MSSFRIFFSYCLLFSILIAYGMPTGCTAPATSRCGEDVCKITLNRACQKDQDCCCSQSCLQNKCQPFSNRNKEVTGNTEKISKDAGPQEGKTPDATVQRDCKKEGATRSCYTGPPSTPGKGVCQEGIQKCEKGKWTKCSQDVTPQKDLCDDVDNDCDGTIDEDFPDKDKACTEGKGECRKTGVLACSKDGTKVECNVSAGTGAKEECGDGKDNDCDGQIDEDCSCKDGETQSCYSGATGCTKEKDGFACTEPCKAGTQTCKNGKWGACENEVIPESELCDGKDNNCDGQVDENHPNLGEKCSKGDGICKTEGTWICSQDGAKVECNATPGTPEKETCNDKDDDCDGQIDEDFPTKGENCEKGKGICLANGQNVCSKDGSGVECNAIQGKPEHEKCDKKDNDCDGQIDEDCECTDGEKQPCYNGQSGCKFEMNKFVCITPCQAGTQTCKDGKWEACQGAIVSQTEVCDDIDNDCDGQVDEDFPQKGKECFAGLGECQSKGKAICSNDGKKIVCNAKPKSSTREVCDDNKDNDCDGKIDEATIGNPCRCKDQNDTKICGINRGACRTGIQSCNNWRGRLYVSNSCSGNFIGPADKETCGDKLDNNCNGLVDEGCQ